MPEVYAQFVDPAQAPGGNYPLGPSAGAYSVTLLVCLVVMVAVGLTYLCGRTPEWVARYDVLSSAVELVKAPGGGYRTRARSSRFGGTLSACFALTALAVLVEVLVQNATGEFGVERTSTAPTPDNSVFSAEDARLEVSLTAARAPGAGRFACAFADIASSNLVGHQLAVVEGTPVGTNATGNLTCAYRLATPNVRLLWGAYAAGVPPGALTLTLGPGLQLAGWEVRLFDGSPGGRHTRAWGGAGVPPDATRGRVHAVALTLTPATFTDRAWVLTSAGVGGATYRGYRAAATGYALANNTAARFLEDALSLQLSLGSATVATERSPRFTGLQLLGVLGGLAAAAWGFWRWAYELLDAAFDCAALTREDGADLACLRGDYVRGSAVGGSAVGGAGGAFAGLPKGGGGGGSIVVAGGSTRDLYALPGETIAQAAARAAIMSQPMVPYANRGPRASLQRAGSARFSTSGRSLSPGGGGGSGGRAAFAASSYMGDDAAAGGGGFDAARAQAISMGYGTAAGGGGGGGGGGAPLAGENPLFGDGDAVAAAAAAVEAAAAADTDGGGGDGAVFAANPARLAAFRSPALGGATGRGRAQVAALVERAPADAAGAGASPARRNLAPSYSFYGRAGMAAAGGGGGGQRW